MYRTEQLTDKCATFVEARNVTAGLHVVQWQELNYMYSAKAVTTFVSCHKKT